MEDEDKNSGKDRIRNEGQKREGEEFLNMTEKEKVLHEATSRITENLSAYGFLLQSKGKTIVKYSADQDMRLEIFFQKNRLSSAKNLEVFPHVYISSKTLKKKQKNEGIPNPTGVIFHSYLGYISPRKPKYAWVISGLSQDNAVKEITEIIKKYACQLFEELSVGASPRYPSFPL